jgi:hypothetical protein
VALHFFALLLYTRWGLSDEVIRNTPLFGALNPLTCPVAHVADNCNSALSPTIASVPQLLWHSELEFGHWQSHYFQIDGLTSYVHHHTLCSVCSSNAMLMLHVRSKYNLTVLKLSYNNKQALVSLVGYSSWPRYCMTFESVKPPPRLVRGSVDAFRHVP